MIKLIHGNGRELGLLADNSVDAIITDHPYAINKQHKGGNRDFTSDYSGFLYTQEDFNEKARVLKEGSFLVEFMPEEAAENYEYRYQVLQMAKSAGLEFYAKVGWKKGNFVSNTGRKSKNSEDLLFFTKGKARSLRPDVKKRKAGIEDAVMSGTAKMLPAMFDFAKDKDQYHQAQKPVDLLAEVLSYITLPGELVVDQFAGSGVLGVAAKQFGVDCILFELDEAHTENIRKKVLECWN